MSSNAATVIHERFADLVRSTRQARRLNKAELARLASRHVSAFPSEVRDLYALSPSYLTRVENGSLLPTLAKATTLATVLRLPMQLFAELLDLAGQSEALAPVEDVEATFTSAATAVREGRYNVAIDRFLCLLHHLETEGDAEATAELRLKTIIQLAVAFRRMSKPHLAEMHLRQALRIDGGVSPRLLVAAFANLANVLRDLGDLRLAETLYLRASELARDCDDTLLELNLKHNLATVLVDLVRYDEAIELSRETSAQFEELGERDQLASSRHTLGLALFRSGRQEAGLKMLAEAVLVGRKLDNPRTTITVTLGYAAALIDSGSADRALGLIDNCNDISTRYDYPDLLFVGTFYRWKEARAQSERAEADRLQKKLLRLRRRLHGGGPVFPEVDEFDAYLEDQGDTP